MSAKQLLKSKGLEYDELNLETHPEFLKLLQKHAPDVRQMPQIFIDVQRVGLVHAAVQQAALKQLGIA